MKKLSLFLALLLITTSALSQLKIATGGNIGIGTNIPTEKLHVLGNTYLAGNVKIDGKSYLNGKLGIGTNTLLSHFQIGDTWTFYNGSGNKIIGLNSYFHYESSPYEYFRIQQGAASQMIFNSSGDIFFQTVPSGSAGSVIDNFSNRLYIKNDGKIGVGTSSPTHTLHVSGELFVNSSTPDWGRAISVKVYHQNACSYNLWSNYHNKDVFFVCGDGFLWTMKGGYFGSDLALKKNITLIEGALQKVKNLQGIRFQFNDDIEEGKEEGMKNINDNENFRLGFVAQDVEKILPEVVKVMPDGTKAMSYTDLIAILVEAIKEQQNMIENLQLESQQGTILRQGTEYQDNILNELGQKVYLLEETLKTCCNTNHNKTKEISEFNNIQQFVLTNPEKTEELKVFQNTPNPFQETTTIKCYIPQNTQKAELCIYNIQGIQIKCLAVSERGMLLVHIQAGELAAGVYTYLLVGDKKNSDAKQMILTR